MNTSQTGTDASPAPSGEGESGDFNHLRNFTGSYYRVLGWLDLASSAIALAICYWTGHLAITFSFVFAFWLGTSLKQGNPTARKWAIVIPILTGTTFAIGLIFPGLKLKLTPWGIDCTHPAFFPLAAISFVILVIPGWMLFGDRGRRAFMGKKEGEQDGGGNSAALRASP